MLGVEGDIPKQQMQFAWSRVLITLPLSAFADRMSRRACDHVLAKSTVLKCPAYNITHSSMQGVAIAVVHTTACPNTQ